MISQSFSSSLAQETENARAFATQYTALILLIITFVIGAFANGPVKGKKPAIVEAAAAEVKQEIRQPIQQKLKSTLYLTDLFLPGTGTLNKEKAQALATMLLSHDIIAEFDLNNFSCNKDSDDLCFKRELQAAGRLRSYLIEKGVPSDALRIFAADAEAKTPVTCRMYEEG